MWSLALYGAETWTHWKVIQEYLESIEMWCWRRMKKIIWTDCVRNEVLQRVKEDRNILPTAKRKKANWVGHICRRNALLKHVTDRMIEGRLEVTGRQRRHKQLLGDFKQKRLYHKLKEEALDCTLWGTRFRRGYECVKRQITE